MGDLGELDTTHVSRVLPVAHQGRAADRRRTQWTAHSMAEARDLLKSFLASVPTNCENCGACSPKIMPEGANKIYRQALTGKQREVNASLVGSAMGPGARSQGPGWRAEGVGSKVI